jgi:hypothetical protein
LDTKIQYKPYVIRKNIIILSAFLLCFVAVSFSQTLPDKADSIITQVLNRRDLYGNYIREYNAQAYIKGNTHVLKKNLLYKYAPDFLYLDKRRQNSFVESIVNVHFVAPNHFTQEIKAINGDKIFVGDIQERVMQFLSVNIYNPTIFNDFLFLPGIRWAFHYYRFEYVTSIDTLGKTIHQIQVIPKINSQKLISGFFYIVDGAWTIYRFDILGKWEFSTFRVQTEFGLQPQNPLLPLKTTISFHLKLLGNEAVNHYFSSFKYDFIDLYDEKDTNQSPDYDLSNFYNVHPDSIPIMKDSSFWAKSRPVPLSDYERFLIENERKPSGELASTVSNNSKKRSWNFLQGLIIPKKLKYNNMQFAYSGLLNPLKLAYSKIDGLLYWQKINLRKQFDDGQELQFNPDLGILFQKKEIYFNTPVNWLFDPKKMGQVYFNIGNRNYSYNFNLINRINKEIATRINFDDLNLDYYRHFHLILGSKYELTNGLLFSGELDYDWYLPVKKKGKTANLGAENITGDLIDIVQNQYKAFIPTIRLQWTPKQFYRINGKQKEYVYSYFPTFTGEYAWGIKNVFGSNSHYQRLEMDVQQKISLGLMRSFHYYIGIGSFINARSVYFADFNNFRGKNIPQSWNDPIGGTFHLLEREWYGAANSYVQAHFMYEAPFVVLRFLKKANRDILKERIYISQLYTPVLPCYTEAGYGFGNFLGNVGIFISFNRGKYESIGARFALELGK